ncbi:MAG: hypothetical protein RR328_02970 [Bacteroidales bacterium]
MKHSNTFFFFSFIFLFSTQNLWSQIQKTEIEKYRRSSLYTVLITHPKAKYAHEIDSVFVTMPISDKYENHNLRIRRVILDTNSQKTKMEHVDDFLSQTQTAKEMVAKWFNRNKRTGAFDVSLLAERGNYNASEMDVEQAQMTKRGLAILSDAGEELIGNTFVIVNDIVYVDKEANAKIAFAIFGAIASIAGSSNTATGDLTKSVADLGASISNLIAGFTVKVSSHLYQLQWNDSISSVFYNQYWCDSNDNEQFCAERKKLFDQNKDLFHLKYIGSYKVKSDKTVMRGIHSNAEVITKVCTRALDKNIVFLQKKYEVFKVKTPIYAIDGKRIESKIGRKEGISEKSQFEVLERLEDEHGKTFYKKVGKIKPIKSEIWDNRCMAFEEQAKGADRTSTTFKIKSGSGFYPGMLIRQIK